MDFKEGVGAMIEKYFNGVIEQVYHRIGNAEKNIVMASYNNDFSVSGLENKKRYQEDDNVFFACCEIFLWDFEKFLIICINHYCFAFPRPMFTIWIFWLFSIVFFPTFSHSIFHNYCKSFVKISCIIINSRNYNLPIFIKKPNFICFRISKFYFTF